jgi:hypothetical protein
VDTLRGDDNVAHGGARAPPPPRPPPALDFGVGDVSTDGEAAAARAPTSRKRRRRSDGDGGGGGSGGGAAGGELPPVDDIIDLCAEEDASVAAAFREWELIDLTGAVEEEEEAPATGAAPASRASARRADVERSLARAESRPLPHDALAAQRAQIRAFLAARGAVLRCERCEPNPHAAPGTPLYARFVAARARCRDPAIQLVWHGTPEANVDAICRNGLDQRRRAGQAMGPGCIANRACQLLGPALSLTHTADAPCACAASESTSPRMRRSA